MQHLYCWIFVLDSHNDASVSSSLLLQKKAELVGHRCTSTISMRSHALLTTNSALELCAHTSVNNAGPFRFTYFSQKSTIYPNFPYSYHPSLTKYYSSTVKIRAISRFLGNLSQSKRTLNWHDDAHDSIHDERHDKGDMTGHRCTSINLGSWCGNGLSPPLLCLSNRYARIKIHRRR